MRWFADEIRSVPCGINRNITNIDDMPASGAAPS